MLAFGAAHRGVAEKQGTGRPMIAADAYKYFLGRTQATNLAATPILELFRTSWQSTLQRPKSLL